MAQVVENPDNIQIASEWSQPDVNIIKPFDFFESGDGYANAKALIILNQNITVCPVFFRKIWDSCELHICADGGSNKLLDFDSGFTPEYIVGDLDSATAETLQFYKNRGTSVIAQRSQYATDLDKAVALTNLYFNYKSKNETKQKQSLTFNDYLYSLNTNDGLCSENLKIASDNSENIKLVLLGAIGGRFDQTLNALSKLYQLNSTYSHIDSILLNPEHTEFILYLPKGKNFIKFPKIKESEEIEKFGTTFKKSKSRQRLRNVGILPMLAPTILRTSGLKWDVNNWESQFGMAMSTCNLQVGETGFGIETTSECFVNVEL